MHAKSLSILDSHFSVQYGNGIVGPIQIDGPASLPYDIDLGPLLLSDYYYKGADEIAFVGGAPPASDNVLYVQNLLQLMILTQNSRRQSCQQVCFPPHDWTDKAVFRFMTFSLEGK